jgi:23S rRNA (uridine2552-2'-O)-methyltransferase
MAPKRGQRRQDHLARRAQAEGFHARSVYKLEALDTKFALFGSSSRGSEHQTRVLDLGAAPGSWSQFAVARGATVTAVDLQEFSVAGVECHVGDFTERSVIEMLAAHGPFDLVMSDAAPATTGNRVVDTGRSEQIVESIIANLDRWLRTGGACVCKLFQGGGEQQLLREMRERFEKGALYRPKAVRSESFETYLVGMNYRAGMAGTIDEN